MSSLVVVIYGFFGSPWSMPNVVMYLVDGAVMEEVESNVTGTDPIMLDTMNRARCGRSQARMRSREDTEIAEATQTGDSTWHLRDTKPSLTIYYNSGRLWIILEHGGMGSQKGGIIQNSIEADRNYWKILHDL